MKRRIYALLAVIAAASPTAPLGGHDATLFNQLPNPDDEDPLDPGFEISQTGPIPLVTINAKGSDAVEFETDACGLLQQIRDSRSNMNRRTGYWNEEDDDDPATGAEALFEQWLSAHPEIAVVNRAVDQWCGKDDIENQEDFDSSEIV